MQEEQYRELVMRHITSEREMRLAVDASAREFEKLFLEIHRLARGAGQAGDEQNQIEILEAMIASAEEITKRIRSFNAAVCSHRDQLEKRCEDLGC